MPSNKYGLSLPFPALENSALTIFWALNIRLR